MSNESLAAKILKYQKAKNFIRAYYEENGQMPSTAEVNEAKELSQEELAKVEFESQIKTLIDQSYKEIIPEWEYIWNEETWDESYANGLLKDYYVWADEKGAYPYKEDLWNEKEGRAANWNDIVKENGTPVEFEDGYHYVDGDGNPCVRCWAGALGAQGAAYPWCAVKIDNPFTGKIKFNYDGGEDVYPWGANSREFKRTFAIASIPTELGNEFLLSNGVTTFDPEKLVVTLIKD